MNIASKILIFFLFLILFASVLFLIKNKLQKQNSLTNLLQEQFKNNYKTRVQVVDDYLITIIESSCPFGDSFNSCKWDEQQTPLIVIQNIKLNNVLSVYRIGFMNNSKAKLDTGNNIWLVNSKYKNGDFKDFVFLTEWGINYGGSSGLKGLVMFQKNNNTLMPSNGYFGKSSKEQNITLTEIQTGKTYYFPVIVDSYFSYYDDLNKDSKTDLLYGWWKWNVGKESHYEARPWYLRVYDYKNNQFEIAKWWNNGKEYMTQENIGYEESDKLKILETFNSIHKLK